MSSKEFRHVTFSFKIVESFHSVWWTFFFFHSYMVDFFSLKSTRPFSLKFSVQTVAKRCLSEKAKRYHVSYRTCVIHGIKQEVVELWSPLAHTVLRRLHILRSKYWT